MMYHPIHPRLTMPAEAQWFDHATSDTSVSAALMVRLHKARPLIFGEQRVQSPQGEWSRSCRPPRIHEDLLAAPW